VAAEKTTGLVLRTFDWSETSRITVFWTREFGKVRALAKGGRRLKSSFENALDLLTVCSIVLVRKSSGSLDVLTEARIARRFPALRAELAALYAGYYLAELLADFTEDGDPHPQLFDESLDTLETLGKVASAPGMRIARFELVLMRELGYYPGLERCVVCGAPASEQEAGFGAAAGGVLCRRCRTGQNDHRPLSGGCLAALRQLGEDPDAWQRDWPRPIRDEVRQILGHYITYLLGRRPRLLPYLGS
jgi:DNA repair protein RecO (recombination protein O)